MSTQNISPTPLSTPFALMPRQAVPALSVPTLDHGLFTLGEDAAPNFTLVAPVRPVPVMVTVVPPLIVPEAGLTSVTVGTAVP